MLEINSHFFSQDVKDIAVSDRTKMGNEEMRRRKVTQREGNRGLAAYKSQKCKL